MQASAFTTVSARTSFNQPHMNTAAYNAPQHAAGGMETTSNGKVGWPEAVRDYVRRAFDPVNAIPGIEKQQMSEMLKNLLTNATQNGQILSIDWPTYPLPQEFLQRTAANVRKIELANASNYPAPTWNGNATSQANVSARPTVSAGKKRKSSEANLNETDTGYSPKQNNDSPRFEDRLTFEDRKHTDRMEKRLRKTLSQEKAAQGHSKFDSDLEKRKQRFGAKALGSPAYKGSSSREDSPNPNTIGPVVGTCEVLEKRYLRLTAPPKADTVRPLHILRQTLDLLKTKWKNEGNYNYICDQFKSLRQDLFVQHIKNEFTVDVYEIHARIALEKGDLGEYNQCQTQLRALYKQKLGGHPAEFLAYRILYFIYSSSRTDMNTVLADLTPTDKNEKVVKHALAVRSALALGNYHSFFKLYLNVPNMGAYLMDMFIQRERLAALAVLCKAYRPEVQVRFLSEELGFDSDEQCFNFLVENGCSKELFDERPSGLIFFANKAASLFENAKKAAFRKVDIKGQI